MEMIKSFILIISVLLLTSCGVYKYQFDEKKSTIVSKKRNSITAVFIKNQNGNTLAQFNAKTENKSKEFSLLNFSPEYFNCIKGCDFSFKKGEKYCISIAPFGDRVRPSIIIELDKNDNLISSQEWCK